MEVKILKSKYMHGIMEQNTYVLLNGQSALIIDAGADLEELKKAVLGKKVEAILMTHLHFDHFWFLDEYLKEFGCNVFVCKGAEEKFLEEAKNGSLLIRKGVVRNIDAKNVKYYENQLNFDNFDVKVYFTPGHSGDCVCLKIDDCLFSGDTVFAGGIGRCDLYDSSTEDMKKSLELIKSLDYKILYSGHYEASTKEKVDEMLKNYL